jgi:hypothetical protein
MVLQTCIDYTPLICKFNSCNQLTIPEYNHGATIVITSFLLFPYGIHSKVTKVTLSVFHVPLKVTHYAANSS